MLTGFENVTNRTLVVTYREIRKGPMSAKARLIERAAKAELDKRRVSPNHPAFALVR